jgi:ribosome biogenesis GTPase A
MPKANARKSRSRKSRSHHGPPRDRWNSLRKLIHEADVIVEVVDSRDVEGTRLRFTEKWIGTARLLIVANKADLLAEGAKVKTADRLFVVSAKTATPDDKRELIEAILSRTRERPARALLLGYPNVGKSTLINSLSGRHAARVSPIAGTTKDVQWIRISDELTIVDYRGVFPEKEERDSLVLKGAVNVHGDEEAYAYVIAAKIIASPVLRKWMEKEYDLKVNDDTTPTGLLELMAERRKWYLKKGELNIAEAARNIVRAIKKAPEL